MAFVTGAVPWATIHAQQRGQVQNLLHNEPATVAAVLHSQTRINGNPSSQ